VVISIGRPEYDISDDSLSRVVTTGRLAGRVSCSQQPGLMQAGFFMPVASWDSSRPTRGWASHSSGLHGSMTYAIRNSLGYAC
jgi:hypothetical protein